MNTQLASVKFSPEFLEFAPEIDFLLEVAKLNLPSDNDQCNFCLGSGPLHKAVGDTMLGDICDKCQKTVDSFKKAPEVVVEVGPVVVKLSKEECLARAREARAAKGAEKIAQKKELEAMKRAENPEEYDRKRLERLARAQKAQATIKAKKLALAVPA